MIQLESIYIEEIRGIKKLKIDLKKETFAISGPNGSGKSGVIDAIEFGLTGQIGRLTGRGTKGLSVTEHGPHVDKTKFPDAAFVELNVFLPTINKYAKILRKVSSPKKPKIEPADDDVLAILNEISNHPEITLSRREILRFILIEPTERSKAIQTILKFNEIGQIRDALNSANNKLRQELRNATTKMESNQTSLQKHLQISTLLSDDILKAVNERRGLLDLPLIKELTGDTQLDAGLTNNIKPSEFNKESAMRDVTSLMNVAELDQLAKTEANKIVETVEILENDTELFTALQRHSFIENGLNFIDSVECPLCDTTWESEELLRQHLKNKLKKSEEARKLQESLVQNGIVISNKIVWFTSLITPIIKIAEQLKENQFAELLKSWKNDLENFKGKLTNVNDIISFKNRFNNSWLQIPQNYTDELNLFIKLLESKPDQTATINAQTFLSTAQLRLNDYREAVRENKSIEIAYQSANTAYEIYCKVLEDELDTLYDEVQKDFSTFYRILNEEDESTFTAKLTPSEGSLGFDVNFYNRGLFPPAAYHSEGHQDGMGVCLYLALMKRLFGDKFTFALFDDVVMSVDTGHRYQFCKLLKTYFPKTQFIITTHDRLWAEQMKSAGLVTAKRSLVFCSWTIDTGPLVESNDEIWNEIANALNKGKVESAAAALRHHLEYTSRHLADLLGATPQFRADGNYELGDLLPAVLSRMLKLYGKASDAAQSWGDSAMKDGILARKNALSSAATEANVEQWAVNKGVHYNPWVNFGKKDFEPVVVAFNKLLSSFSCEKCNSWLYATPRTNPDTIRCNCNAININLNKK